ncbi:MAG: acetyl-CoA carboxylase biotin carboxyl carrier protein [Panacagrimonas sp.]
MALSEQELLQVLEMFQKSGWQEMQLHSGNRKLVMSKTGRVRPAARLEPAFPVSVERTATPAPPPVQASAPVATSASIGPRWLPVKAPMLGTFYAAPKPGAAAFVTLGQDVSAEDTVGILEVMKLMNYLKAGIAGRIAKIVAANGDLVEFDQVLFYIEPGAA